MEFHFRMYGVSRRMCHVRVTYVWRMKCTRDVSTVYVKRSILICGVYVRYQLVFNTVVFTLFMQFTHYSYQLSEVEDAT